jgi:hypothetical protein
MAANLGDLTPFVAVARAGGFRDAARASGGSASSLSEAVRRLEARLGVRLLNRTTRSVARPRPARGCSSGSARRWARSRPRSTWSTAFATARRARCGSTCRSARRGWCCRASCRRSSPPIPTSAGGDRRGQLRRHARRRLRRRHPLRRAAGAGHDRRADRPARAALRDAASPGLSRPRGRPEHPRDLLATPACAAASPAARCRPGSSSATARSCAVDPTGPLIVRRRGDRSRRRRRDRRHRRHPPVRGLAAPASRQRRARAGAGALVADVSPGRFSTIPAAATCPRRCARSSISS